MKKLAFLIIMVFFPTIVWGFVGASGDIIQYDANSDGIIDLGKFDMTVFDADSDGIIDLGAFDATGTFLNATIPQVAVATAGAVEAACAATKVNNLIYSNSNGTITDFVDSDGDHSEFVAGQSFFIFRMVDASTTIDFSANTNIEGNGGMDYTGSATQITDLLFLFDNIGGTGTWICLNLNTAMSDPTTLAIKSVEVPTLAPSELNDPTSAHVLTVAELKGTVLSNIGAGATEYDFPARTEGWNFIYVVEAAQNVVLDPNGTEQWYLNGAQMAAGENVVNLAADIGDTLTVFSTGTSVFCTSNDADWAQESP